MIPIKIGEFSKKCNLTKETIRYYTDEKMLLPCKIKHYYDYNHQCEIDIRAIKKLKRIGFSVSEIKVLLNYMRIDKEAFTDMNAFLLDFFKAKLKEIDEEKKLLEYKYKDLKEIVDCVENMVHSPEPKEIAVSGIDLQFLSLLRCDRCGCDLQLKQAEVIDSEIVNGKLGCSCGMEYVIQEGILLFDGFDMKKIPPVIKTKKDVEKKFPSEYFSNRLIVEQWLKDKIQKDLKNNDILLDSTVTGGLYFLKLFEEIKEKDILYINCERRFNFLKSSKKAVDALPNRPRTMFCSGDIRKAPFKPSLFDKIIDVYGSIVDMRDTGEFKIPYKINLLKDYGKFYGIYYDICNLSDKNTENLRRSLDFSLIEKELQGLTKLNFMSSPKTKEFGEFNKLLQIKGNEELTFYSYIGRKE